MGIATIFISIFIAFFLTGSTTYLYKGTTEKLSMLKNYSDCYCLHINKNYNSSITSDAHKLGIYKEMYITANDNISKFNEVFQGKNIDNGIVVYVDQNKYRSSGYDVYEELDKIKKVSGFKNVKLLGKQDCSYSYYSN